MSLERWSDRIWVIRAGSGGEAAEDVAELCHKLDALDDGRAPHVVVDLHEVGELSNSQLDQLVRLRDALGEHGAHLRIAGPSNKVWATMLTSELDKAFEFASDTPSALAELQIDP